MPNSRDVINSFLGYWDVNPAPLMPLSPKDSTPLYVEMMGGSATIIKKGQELYEQATPNMPLERRLRYGTGIQYELNKDMTIGCAYEFFDLMDAAIDLNRGLVTGTLTGDYSTNQVHLFDGVHHTLIFCYRRDRMTA